jgi:ABC-2 type transport system permease protein
MALGLNNRALWRKAIVDARALLIASMILMFAFHWIYVWITSQIRLGALAQIIRELPKSIQNLSGVPIDQVATVPGRIAVAYIDQVVLLTTGVWGIARGSDVVSGEINRGTMELLVSQPVRRFSILWTQSVVTVAGAALIAGSAWLGTCAGIGTVALEQPVSPSVFVPAALNVFALTFFLAGVSTMVSSGDQYRWRTIGLMGGFFVIGLITKVLSRTVPDLNWLRYFTFFGAFEPQQMVTAMVESPASAWTLSLQYDGVLLGLGMASFIAAALIFCRRDLPAPL